MNASMASIAAAMPASPRIRSESCSLVGSMICFGPVFRIASSHGVWRPREMPRPRRSDRQRSARASLRGQAKAELVRASRELLRWPRP